VRRLRIPETPDGEIDARVEVSRRVRFEAAHNLPDHDGECRFVHGHSWEAWITVAGELLGEGPQKGMVCDMAKISEHFKTVLEVTLDHKLLNHSIPEEFCPPTTENVARYLMASYLGAGFPVVRVTVRETENQTATVTA
jgi:6-pyruvoyltetrahydropterin/6-carboxytetrahydropterin synthase